MVSPHQEVNLPNVSVIGNLSHIGLPPGTIKAKLLSTLKGKKKDQMIMGVWNMSRNRFNSILPKYSEKKKIYSSVEEFIVTQKKLKIKKIRKDRDLQLKDQ